MAHGGMTVTSHVSLTAAQDSNRLPMRVLWLSTLGFALMFASWTMFGVLGVPVQKELGVSDIQLAWLSAAAILNGALWRLPFGLLADRQGGKAVFIGNLLLSAGGAFVVSRSFGYGSLIVGALLVGFAGNSFTVGSAWCAAWFPPEKQGFAMGFFGAGNVGASVTKFIGPFLISLVPPVAMLGGLAQGGWRFVPFLYALILLTMALAVWIVAPRADKVPASGRSPLEMLWPLREVRVWRFGLYYTIVFGVYVAMAVTLPKYYVNVYGLPLAQAALLTTPFIFASSLLRPVGGVLSDRYGPRRVTYAVFIATLIAALVLSMRLNVVAFTGLVLLFGIAQGIGKASTIKYIPEYYPKDVGAVVGLVGALAALGGFALPPVFAYLAEWTGRPESMFWALGAMTGASLLWLHAVVLGMNKRSALAATLPARDAAGRAAEEVM